MRIKCALNVEEFGAHVAHHEQGIYHPLLYFQLDSMQQWHLFLENFKGRDETISFF